MLIPDGLFRLLDMFGPAVNQLGQQQSNPTAAPPQPEDTNTDVGPQQDIIDRIMSLYKPQTDVSDQYRALLANPPVRNDPGKLGKIFGVMSALGAGVRPAGIAGGQPIGFVGGRPGEAQDAYEQTAYAPYYQQLGDFERKAKILGAGATEEEKANANQRGVLIGAARNAVSQDRADTYARKADAEIEIQKEKVDIQRQRAAAYVFHQNHPTFEFEETADGYILATDKTNPSHRQFLTDPDTNEKIKAARLPEEQKMILGFKQAKGKIEAQGAEARKTEAAKESNRQADIRARGAQQRETNQDKTTAPKNETPTQARARLFNKIRDAYNTHPEWQPYLDVKAGTVTPAPDPRINQAIHDYLYGQDIALPKDNAKPPAKLPPVGEERVEVKDKDTGKVIGTIPKSDIPKVDTGKYLIGGVVK